MSLLRPGLRLAVVRVACAPSAVLLVSVLVSACSSTAPVNWHMSGYASGTPGRLAGMPPRPYVEIEDDGREAQLPPLRRNDQAPDDPAEPFSPDYGSMPRAWTVTVTPEPAQRVRAVGKQSGAARISPAA